jgi:hypothetical protein
MFDQVGDSGFIVVLMSAAGFTPEADRRTANIGDWFDKNSNAIRKGELIEVAH